MHTYVCGRMRQTLGAILGNGCIIAVSFHLTPCHVHVGIVSAHSEYVQLVSTPAMCLSTGHGGVGTIVESVVAICDPNDDNLSSSLLCVQVQLGHWVCCHPQLLCHQWQSVYLRLQPLHPQLLHLFHLCPSPLR